MEEKIAIIGSGILAKEFCDRAKELNIESHCFSFDRDDVACSAADVFHCVDIFDTDTITNICKKEGISGVIATTELTIYPAAVVANNIGALGNKLDVARNITNKYYVRNQVKEVDELYQPKYIICNNDIPRIDSFPVVVKPIAAGGKRGVCVAYSQGEIDKAVEEAAKYSKVKGVLIEQFLEGGQEYSVESITYKGKTYVIQVTQKDSSGPPHCNELGHHQPADLTAEMRTKVERVVSKMLDAVGIENAPCHTEIKIINEKIYLIEINGRPGGDHIIYPLSEMSTGYPTMSGIIWAALGKLEGNEPVGLQSIQCGIYFVTDKTHYLKPLFDVCQNYKWCYEKNQVSENPTQIKFNDEEGLNYFIYYKEKPDISVYMN